MSKLIDVDEAIINFGFEWDDIPPTREEFVLFLKNSQLLTPCLWSGVASANTVEQTIVFSTSRESLRMKSC